VAGRNPAPGIQANQKVPIVVVPVLFSVMSGADGILAALEGLPSKEKKK